MYWNLPKNAKIKNDAYDAACSELIISLTGSSWVEMGVLEQETH